MPNASNASYRPAGIVFDPTLKLQKETLPRMDVAVFVGFASKGRLHKPWLVESVQEFTKEFGEDLSLAWDMEQGEEVRAYLAPTVRAFFGNGGRRCWIIRVDDPIDLDGSARFSSDIFVDKGLKNMSSEELMTQADFLRYQSPTPRKLKGIHAALEIEEATMISVPDAVHLGWKFKGHVKAADPDNSSRSFLPEYETFSNCRPGEISAPVFKENSLPDNGTGSFQLSWSEVPGADYILEEATHPDWSGAAVIYEGNKAEFTLLGYPQGDYYYRVSARVEGKRSAWSLRKCVQILQSKRAKLNQVDQFDQTSNSYHLMCAPTGDYVAKHHYVFNKISVTRDRWQKIVFLCHNGRITLNINGCEVCSFHDWKLRKGYCFLGIKGGEVRLRNIELKEHAPVAQHKASHGVAYDVLHPFSEKFDPLVIIVTTVYDRTDCLSSCIKSVKKLQFRDYEQIIVSDSPSTAVVDEIKEIVSREDNGKIMYVNLNQRFNDWGITPAAVGLQLIRGNYVTFLSDDNGYTPDHIGNLLNVLKKEQGLGFVYSSCRYDGRLMLRSPIPRPGRIDLGQPLFRSELFFQHLGGTIPFNVMAWDWHMIEAFIKKGVRWKHVDIPSFLFRLKKYPQYMAA